MNATKRPEGRPEDQYFKHTYDRPTLPNRAEIVARLDLVDLLGRLTGGAVRVRGNTGQSSCPNPQHAQTGATPPASIDITKQVWHCHGCGARGSAIDALMVAGGLNTAEAMRAASNLAGLSVDEWRLPAAPPRIVAPPRPPAVVRPINDPELLRGYAEHRHWRPAVLTSIGVHLASYGAVTRLIIPAVPGDLTQGWQGRALSPHHQPRWLTGAHFVGPYGFHRLAETTGPVLVVEGASDYVTAVHLAAALETRRDFLTMLFGEESGVECDRWPTTIAAPGAQNWRDGWAKYCAGRTVIVTGDNDEAGTAYMGRVVEDCRRYGVEVCISSFGGEGDLTDELGDDHEADARRLLDILTEQCTDIDAGEVAA